MQVSSSAFRPCSISWVAFAGERSTTPLLCRWTHPCMQSMLPRKTRQALTLDKACRCQQGVGGVAACFLYLGLQHAVGQRGSECPSSILCGSAGRLKAFVPVCVRWCWYWQERTRSLHVSGMVKRKIGQAALLSCLCWQLQEHPSRSSLPYLNA